MRYLLKAKELGLDPSYINMPEKYLGYLLF
jgi:hypothetical protein